MLQTIKVFARRRAPAVVELYRKYRRWQNDGRIALLPRFEPAPAGTKRRLLIEVSSTSGADHVTGIQRVVARLSKELIGNAIDSEFEPVLICLKLRYDKLHLERATEFQRSLGLETTDETELALRPNDVIFMLDSSWVEFRKYADYIFPSFKRQGGTVITCLYDLIPISHPQFCDQQLTRAFTRWMPLMISHSDAVLCISNATATAFRDYLSARQLSFKGPIESFHLGADFHHDRDLAAACNELIPTVLMVGTIEPRKGHKDALAAFGRLWQAGNKVRLHILGKNGWLVDDLIEKIQRHPRHGTDLILTMSASDADLASAYHEASLILSASLIEGFCLPLVEAASFGKPLLVSRIPSTQEVCGHQAIYFEPNNPDDLAAKLEAWLDDRKTPEPISYLSWKESAGQVTQCIAGALK